jgi:uncharacterized membrane protein
MLMIGIGSVVASGLVCLAGPVRADEPPESLVFAVYDSESGATDAFKSMQEAQHEKVIRMQSYAVVSKDQKSKVHVLRSNQKKHTTAGAVIGGLIGSIGGPAGAAVGAAAGGGIGYATGEAMGIPRRDIETIKTSLTPGSSALIAVIDERWANDLNHSLSQTAARQVLQSKIEHGQSGGESPPPSGVPPSSSGTAPSPMQQQPQP